MSVDSHYNSQFIQIDFRLLENPDFIRFVHRAEFATYLILRRYIWRGGEHRLGLHKLYHQDRKLASSISGKRMAELLGMRDVTKISKHLTYLVDLKVVERIRTGRESIFVLGEWFMPTGWDVSKEFYYLENVFGTSDGDLPNPQNQTWPKRPNQNWPNKPNQTWPKRPNSNIEENKEWNTVNGGKSPLATLPDLERMFPSSID
jgi:hypothetical protein